MGMTVTSAFIVVVLAGTIVLSTIVISVSIILYYCPADAVVLMIRRLLDIVLQVPLLVKILLVIIHAISL